MHIPYATVWKLIDLGIDFFVCLLQNFNAVKWMTWFPEHNNVVVRYKVW